MARAKQRTAVALSISEFESAYKESISCFEVALRSDPENSRARSLLGLCRLYSLDAKSARFEFEACLRSDSENIVAKAGLASALSDEAGDLAKQVALYDEVFEADPTFRMPLSNENTATLLRQRRQAKAKLVIQESNTLAQSNEATPELFALRAQAFLEIGSTEARDRAISELAEALRLDPHHADSELQLIRAKGGVLSEAMIEPLKECLAEHPNHAATLRTLGQVSGTRESVALFRKALECDPSIRHTHCALAQSLVYLGEFHEAHAEFFAELTIDPNCFEAHLYLIEFCRVLGDIAGGRRHFDEACRTTPHHSSDGGTGVTLNDSLVTWISRLPKRFAVGNRPKLTYHESEAIQGEALRCARKALRAKAIELYTELVEDDPNNATLLAYRGACRMDGGDAVGAIQDLKLACEVEPQNGTAYFNLAVTYSRVGEDRLAKQNLDTALELDPSLRKFL